MDGENNTELIQAYRVRAGDVIVGLDGRTEEVSEVLDLDGEIIIFSDNYAFNVGRYTVVRILKREDGD